MYRRIFLSAVCPTKAGTNQVAQVWPKYCWLATISLHVLVQVQNDLQTLGW